jgi:hypothetical protein
VDLDGYRGWQVKLDFWVILSLVKTAKERGRSSVLNVVASFLDGDVPLLPAFAYGTEPPGTKLLKLTRRRIAKKRHP